MTDAARPGEATRPERPGDVAGAVARVTAHPGAVVAVDLSPQHLQALLDGVELADEREAHARLVLGAACTTAIRAVDQFVVALQLPYAACRGWADFLDHLSNRPVNRREYVVVADAADLLRHEEPDLWHRLMRQLPAGPFCLGGGWTTLVLVDDAYGWERSPFGTAAGAEEAARTGTDKAARPR